MVVVVVIVVVVEIASPSASFGIVVIGKDDAEVTIGMPSGSNAVASCC